MHTRNQADLRSWNEINECRCDACFAERLERDHLRFMFEQEEKRDKAIADG